jgi:hypothetical protein
MLADYNELGTMRVQRWTLRVESSALPFLTHDHLKVFSRPDSEKECAQPVYE